MNQSVASLPRQESSGALHPASSVLTAAIAERLHALAAEVEALGADLCTDEHVVDRHLSKLQGIDHLAQSLNQIGSVLTASDASAAVETITLQNLKEDLNRALWAESASFTENGDKVRHAS